MAVTHSVTPFSLLWLTCEFLQRKANRGEPGRAHLLCALPGALIQAPSPTSHSSALLRCDSKSLPHACNSKKAKFRAAGWDLVFPGLGHTTTCWLCRTTQLTSDSYRSNRASASASNGAAQKSPVSESDYWCGRQKELKGEQSSYGSQFSSQRPGEMGMPI